MFLNNDLPIHYIYAFNDELAYQVWQITKELGYQKKINIVGVDGLAIKNGGIQLVNQGILKATVLYPTGGSEAIKIARKILRKENVLKNYLLNTTGIVIVLLVNVVILSFTFKVPLKFKLGWKK